MMNRLAIIWANPWNKNLGVAALAYSALYIINKVVKRNKLNVEITIVGSETTGESWVNIGDEQLSVRTLKGNDFYSIKGFIKSILKWKDYRLDLLIRQDVIFDVGEGDSFSDIYGLKRFNRVYGSKVYFNRLRLKQVLMPQTIGPFTNKLVKKKAIAIMEEFSCLIPRDAKSYEFVESNVNNKSCFESLDMAFFLPFNKLDFEEDFIEVGLNISGLIWNGGYTKNNQFALKVEYESLIENIISFFTQQSGVRLHLISHVIPDDDKNVESDYGVAEMLSKKYGGVIQAPRFNSPIDAKSYISGLDFFLGARMHSCIAAFSSGVPFLPMAYSRKFNGLFIQTLNYEFIADMVCEDNKTVMEKVISCFEERKTLKNIILASHKNIILPRQQKLENLLSDIILNA